MTDVLLATCADWPDGEPAGELLVKAFADRGLDACLGALGRPGRRLVGGAGGRGPQHLGLRGAAGGVPRLGRARRAAGPACSTGPRSFRWNTDKSYLLDLERARRAGGADRAARRPGGPRPRSARGFGGRVVVKPRVGAGGRGLTVQDAGPDLGASRCRARRRRASWPLARAAAGGVGAHRGGDLGLRARRGAGLPGPQAAGRRRDPRPRDVRRHDRGRGADRRGDAAGRRDASPPPGSCSATTSATPGST